VSGSPPCAASLPGTAAGSGPKARSIKARHSTSRCKGGSCEPRKILLVEDNPDDVTLTMRALKSHNITNDVVVAQDGVEAIDYLFGTKVRPAAADLPGRRAARPQAPQGQWHGGAAAYPLRGAHALLPVVILTPRMRSAISSMGTASARNSYVRKPVDFVEFTKAAQQLALLATHESSATVAPRPLSPGPQPATRRDHTDPDGRGRPERRRAGGA